jgi:hypothetical protein
MLAAEERLFAAEWVREDLVFRIRNQAVTAQVSEVDHVRMTQDVRRHVVEKTPEELAAIEKLIALRESEDMAMVLKKTAEARLAEAELLRQSGADNHALVEAKKLDALQAYAAWLKVREEEGGARRAYHQSLAAIPGSSKAKEVFESPYLNSILEEINPSGAMNNCLRCADATASTLSGPPWVVLPTPVIRTEMRSLDQLKMIFQVPEQLTGLTLDKVESQLLGWGDGAHALVAGSRKEGSASHIFNVVNDAGRVLFIDRQTDGRGLVNYHSYKDWMLIRQDRPELAPDTAIQRKSLAMKSAASANVEDTESSVLRYVEVQAMQHGKNLEERARIRELAKDLLDHALSVTNDTLEMDRGR